MVSLNQITKGYEGDHRVLDRVSLELKRGDFLYIVGESGAGKSTLLRMLATEETPTAGELTLFGIPLRTASKDQVRSVRRAIGYVPQSLRLVPDLTVEENVDLALAVNGTRGKGAASRAKIHEILERLGLGSRKKRPCRELSGGEAQRVAVARALASEPELLIADEPTGAQDRDLTWAMMDLFARANLSGTTVVLATHDREIVRRFRKRCAVLKGGRIGFEDGLCAY